MSYTLVKLGNHPVQKPKRICCEGKQRRRVSTQASLSHFFSHLIFFTLFSSYFSDEPLLQWNLDQGVWWGGRRSLMWLARIV